MYRHQLAENMAGQFTDDQAMFRQHSGEVIAVGLALRRGGYIKQTPIPCRNLQCFEAGFRRPSGNRRQAVERGYPITELGEMQAWAFDGFHRKLLLFVD